MTQTSHVTMSSRWRLGAIVLLVVGFALTTVLPATAQEAGTGAGTGTENEIDVADPPVDGSSDAVFPLCARAKDGDFDGTTNGISAKYTVNVPAGTYVAPGAVYEGPLTITIETGETFFFGPQGTHYGGSGNDCSTGNLGSDGKIPATITIQGDDGDGNFVGPCTDTDGRFWRTSNAFEAEWTATCDVDGNQDELGLGTDNVTVTSDHTFTGDLQPPCNVIPGYDCLQGVYTQEPRDGRSDGVGGGT